MGTMMSDKQDMAAGTRAAAVTTARIGAGMAGLAMASLLAGCLDPGTSPLVAQAENATLVGSVWVLTDAHAVGGKALKLSPRHGLRVAYYPGDLPLTSAAVRLRTDGCPVGTGINYSIHFKANATGATTQLGGVRSIGTAVTDGAQTSAPDSPWTTVALSKEMATVNQLASANPDKTGGSFEIRQLAHTNTSLPSTCGLAVDQGALRGTGSPGFANTIGAGKPRMFLRTNGGTDGWMGTVANQPWIASHFHRAELHRPHADQYLPWFNGGLVYFKSHAANGFAVPDPTWILKSATGQEARINWSGGGCNVCQPALDIGNPAVRTFLIGKAQAALAGPNNKSFKGLWVDDVNMSLGLVSPTGQALVPRDPRTNQPMTNENWQKYMAEWMEALRAALPASVEIYHNSKYYWDAWGNVAYTTRQIAASTGIHLEGGFTDGGLGNDPWIDSPFSVAALGRYIKKIHDQGRVVIMDNYASNDAMRDYSLAAYFMFSGDRDMIANTSAVNPPADFWPAYDSDLGAPTTAAPTLPSSSGLWRRDFANGVALLLQPTGTEQTVTLPSQMVDGNGSVVTQVRLKPKQAVVLTKLPVNGIGGGGMVVKPSTFAF